MFRKIVLIGVSESYPVKYQKLDEAFYNNLK